MLPTEDQTDEQEVRELNRDLARRLRKENKPGIEYYINNWLPILLYILLGMFIQKFIQRPDYREYPPRAIQGQRVTRYKDSVYYMNTIIDSANLDFGR